MSKFYLTKDLIKEFPKINSIAKKWIEASSINVSVSEEIAWINRELSRLHIKDRKNLIGTLISDNINAWSSFKAEISYLALWNFLHWEYIKDPKILGVTPDFQVFYGKEKNQLFLLEISCVKHNYPHQNIEFDPETSEFKINGRKIEKLPTQTSPIKQDYRITTKVKQKFTKYENRINENAFLVGLYLAAGLDQFYLSDFQIKNALYGELKVDFHSGEYSYNPNLIKTEHCEDSPIGLFGFEEFQSLTGVLICKQEYINFDFEKNIGSAFSDDWKSKFILGIFMNPCNKFAKNISTAFGERDFPLNGILRGNALSFNGNRGIEFY